MLDFTYNYLLIITNTDDVFKKVNHYELCVNKKTHVFMCMQTYNNIMHLNLETIIL